MAVGEESSITKLYKTAAHSLTETIAAKDQNLQVYRRQPPQLKMLIKVRPDTPSGNCSGDSTTQQEESATQQRPREGSTAQHRHLPDMPSLYSEIVTGGKDTTSAARPPGGFIPLSEVGEVSLTLIDEDCDDLLRRSTIQLHLSGRHALLTRREAIVAVLIASGVPKAEIIGLWKGENPRLINVTFTRPEFVPTVLEASPMTLPQGVTAHVEHADCAVVEIRIHWVPLYIQNSLITRSFEQIGRVKEIQTEREDDGSDKVTVKGRASTCLVCGRPDTPGETAPTSENNTDRRPDPLATAKTTPRRDDKEPSTAPTLTVLGRLSKACPETQSQWTSRGSLRRASDPAGQAGQHPHLPSTLDPKQDKLQPGEPHRTPPRSAINAAPEGLCA
ncbi:hypothetical protein C0Q70_15446 [Pomacea canaliculata]|uniref:Uncharacterized protein n=1 Tax=Pomacea canaliculata TaxID=400727 RepID=A0A2T7NUW2_POMCA|nr:hypothetical protein C0Q70_15446 [Pomacea canaliculata]